VTGVLRRGSGVLRVAATMVAGAAVLALMVAGCSGGSSGAGGGQGANAAAPTGAAPAVNRATGGAGGSPTPRVTGGASQGGAGATNVYAGAGPGMLTAATRTDKPLVYVPNTLAGTVSVIDPRTDKVAYTFKVGSVPQHVVPSWDLKTLWVNDNSSDDLVPIDPRAGRPGHKVAVPDPYNLYFSPDGSHAMVMAERLGRIDFRDPHTMKLQHSLPVPCHGVNHADVTADGSTFLVSCEFSGKLLVVPADGSRVAKVLNLNEIRTPGANDPMAAMRHGGPASSLDRGASSMPQDVRLVPDGTTFLVADMMRNGVWLIDAATMSVRGFLHTGKGAHGIYPSRDGSAMYVSNRDEGTVSVLDARTLDVRALWRIPGGGSPDMGGVTADGTQLWLSGRSNNVVYVFDTRTGKVIHEIPVGAGPHGLCVWPQPGRYSLGHTGNTR
jgi:YVTN family beta-propeller protein